MNRIARIGVAAAVALACPVALAQLSFPTSAEDWAEFYPTAYYDHGNETDWNCGSNTYSGHRGSDFGGGGFAGMAEGRDIVAAAAGVVLYTNDGEFDQCTTGDCEGGGGYGNYVWIQQYDGRQAIYAHMAQWSVAVSTGDAVECGDLLGLMGSSGYSTGPHLHFEIRDAADSRVDPFAGPCSDTPESLWASQGAYGALPAIQCGEPADCEPVALVTCGAVIASSNEADGSTSGNGFYGCTEWMYSGPEISWRFVTDLDEPVHVSLTGLSADLDLYAVGSEDCDGEDCIASSSESGTSDESMTFDATAGVEVVLVVDGFEGAVSDFELRVECQGGIPDSGPDASDDGGEPESPGGHSGGGGSGDGMEPGSSSDCGCRAVGLSPGSLLSSLFT